MGREVEKTSKPEAGDYLENGSRLVRVMGYTKAGELLIEDAVTEATEVLESSQLGSWRRVRRRKVAV